MNTKLILIITFSALYGLFEIFMSRRLKSKRNVSKSGDKRSIWFLTISISIGYWLSFIMAATKTGRIYHWNTFFITGSILALIGLIIRVTSILTLKQQFTYTVTKIENHELIETGLYKVIRHPGYLGQLIIFLGISTCLSNWLSILPLVIGVMLGNLDPDMRTFLSKAGMVMIPFFAFGLGCGINLETIYLAGFSGILLGLLTILVCGFFTILTDKVSGGSGVAGAANSSTAGNAVATPASVAMVDPSLSATAAMATPQEAAAVITTALLVPVLTAYIARRNKRKLGKI